MIRRLVAALLVAAAPGLAQAQIAIIAPDVPLGDSTDRIVNTRYLSTTLLQGIPLAAGTIFIGSASNFATSRVMSGDCSISTTGILTCTQSAGNFKVNGALTVTGGATVTGTLTVNGAIVDTSGGLTLGNPIGGSKGPGTVNASIGYYVNGVLLPTISPSVPLPLSMGGTGGSLVPSAGGIVYTDAFGMRVLPSPFPGKFLRSGLSAPNWTQTTWSDTYPSYSLVYSNGPNNIQALAPGTDGQMHLGQTNLAPAWKTMSGDCTLSAAGAITCTKSNGTAFGTAAFQNTGTSGANLPFLNGTNTWSGVQTFNDGDALIAGSTSGTLQLRAAAVAGTSVVRLPAGSTDFTATGGTSQVVKQTSAGGALTVAQLATTDLSDITNTTWTPDCKNTSSSSTFATKSGWYSKTGNFVTAWFYCDSGNSGTAGSILTITGFPAGGPVSPNTAAAVIGHVTTSGFEGSVLQNGSLAINGATSTLQVTFVSGFVMYRTN